MVVYLVPESAGGDAVHSEPGGVWMHLNHGVSSAFKTLGLYNKSYRKWVMALGSGFAFMIAVGNIFNPVACFDGDHPVAPNRSQKR